DPTRRAPVASATLRLSGAITVLWDRPLAGRCSRRVDGGAGPGRTGPAQGLAYLHQTIYRRPPALHDPCDPRVTAHPGQALYSFSASSSLLTIIL
ncbi:MAG: hypothetical protein AVDCRST_MAG49-2390, partial [uncultured Thermomicrobiales bacterium]